VAADPRGLGGLRADKIKSLGMTAGPPPQPFIASAATASSCGGRGPPGAAGGPAQRGSGWAQELVIDGKAPVLPEPAGERPFGWQGRG
jgi:hypothetical protein